MRLPRAVPYGALCLVCALISVVIAAGSDRLAPQVSIAQPEDSATLQGSTDLLVQYVSSSKQPIVRVDIWIDEGRVVSYKLKDPVLKGKAQFQIHTAQLTDGLHRLQAQVFDAAGHAGQAQISIHVQNESRAAPVPKVSPPEADLIPPAVRVHRPENGARISGRMQVSIEATDETKVLCVLLFVDDEFAAMRNFEPYNFDVETTKLSEGIHTVNACAFDAAQNKGESAKTYFVVDNARATTPSMQPLKLQPDIQSRGPESLSIESGAPESAAAAPLARPAETAEGAATSAPRPAPELAMQSDRLPTTERVASAPRLAMPERIKPSREPSPAVTTLAQLDGGQATAVGIDMPTRTSVALRPTAMSRSGARAAAVRGSETAHMPARSKTPSGQVASVPALPAARTRAPVPSYSPVESPVVLAAAKPSAPGRTLVASGRMVSQPQAQTPVPATVRTDRAERYAMLPRSVVTVAAPKRDTVATSAGQRISSPGTSFVDAKHVIHLGGKEVPVVFDKELLKLRTRPTERAGIAVGPFREIFEHTGGIVHWFPVDKRVTAYSSATTVALRIGHAQAKVDDETVWLELAPFIKNGRTMVPFDFISKVLDVTVKYEPKSGRILITSNKF
jgi:hypothetical protein